MARYFPSKVDRWYYLSLVALAVAILGGPAMVWIFEPQEGARATMNTAPIGVLVMGFMVWLLRSTGYTLEPTRLLVKSGPMSWVIPLADIHSIKPTRNPLSSPALSLDRLMIKYGKYGHLMISPADKEDFLREVEALRLQLKMKSGNPG